MSTLTAAALAAQDRPDPLALPMKGRTYTLDVLHDGEWRRYDRLSVAGDHACLGARRLENPEFNSASNSMSFGKGTTGCHRGRLHFTEVGHAFTGRMVTPEGLEVAVQGHQTEQAFATERAPKGSSDFTAWEQFVYGTQWIGQGTDRQLTAFFTLGGNDVSDRTAVVDVTDGVTTIVMEPSDVLLGPKDTFTIKIPVVADSFAGAYTDADGTAFEWKGTAAPASMIARQATVDAVAARPLESEVLAAASTGGPDDGLNVTDLLGVSSIYAAEVNGETKVVDRAQVQTGRYFQNVLISSLDKQWIDDFFGDAPALPDGVKAVKSENQDFYSSTAVLNMGQMLHDAFKNSADEKKYVEKIDQDKLAKAWKDLGKSKGYAAQSSPLYVQGYRDGVTDIQPFLPQAKMWASKLHDELTSERHLTQFSVQVASSEFKHVRQQMYEWWVQMSVLDPDNRDAAQQVLAANFSVVVATQFNNLTWTDEMKPYLAEVIDNMLHGDASGFYDDPMREKELENLRETLAQMTGLYDNSIKFADELFNVFSIKAIHDRKGLAEIGEGAYEQMVEENPGRWAQFKAGQAPKVIAAIAYGVGAGFLLYNLITGAGSASSPKKIVEEVNLGLLAMGALLKGVQKLMATKLGEWLIGKAESGATRLAEIAEGVSKWFTEEGIDVGESLAKAFLTKNAAEFMAKRIGPALALFAIVMSAWSLADDIKAGDIQDIVFDSINTAFALADAVFIGLDLMTVGWAGPVGLAVAAVGLLVAFIQILVDIFHPPPPPPDPVEQFVDGPLAAAGFVN